MITNFVTPDDLLRLDASIDKYLPKGQPDWQPQIDEAFEMLKDRLRARSISARKLGIPIDLHRPATSTDPQNDLTAATLDASGTAAHVSGLDGFRRFVLDVTAISEGLVCQIVLDGSNDRLTGSSPEPVTWRPVTAIAPTEVKRYSVVFQPEFRHYRRRCVISGGSSPSVEFTASIVETYYDRWIQRLALFLIYSMFAKEPGDLWESKAKVQWELFEQSFENHQFSYDANDDNLVSAGENVYKPQLRFTR